MPLDAPPALSLLAIELVVVPCPTLSPDADTIPVLAARYCASTRIATPRILATRLLTPMATHSVQSALQPSAPRIPFRTPLESEAESVYRRASSVPSKVPSASEELDNNTSFCLLSISLAGEDATCAIS